MILGSGFAYYKHADGANMSRSFLKIEFVLLAASVLICGAKFIYFGKSVTIPIPHARYYYATVPGFIIGPFYLSGAIWIIWQFVLHDNEER